MVLVHEVTEALPDIAKLMIPLGAVELVEPVTVAVKSTEPPRVGVVDALRPIVGVAVETVVVVVEALAATELYAASPAKVNVAP